jgi:hypothetical protein
MHHAKESFRMATPMPAAMRPYSMAVTPDGGPTKKAYAATPSNSL